MRKLLILLMVITVTIPMTTGVWAESGPSDGYNVTAAEVYEDEEFGDIIPDGWNADRTQYFVSGEPVTGLFFADGNLFYADESGYVETGSRILTVEGRKYILRDGVVLTSTGVVTFEGKYYYVGENGIVRTEAGFLNNKGYRYYVQPGGVIRTSSKFTVGGNTYLAGSNGRLRSGLVKWKGRYIYFNRNYTLNKKAGFVRAGGQKYFNKKNGGITTKAFVKWKKKYYYAGKHGAIKTRKFKYKKRTVRPNPKTGAISRYDYMIAIGKYKKSPYHYDKYILIDISSQKLTYYVGGRKKLRCSVVTGNRSAGHSTPRGKYRVRGKSRGVTLKGPGYSSYVSYWMPFLGNAYGMHDASWRSSFGGGIYKYNGSHGCVNMPRWAARKLYNKVSVGTIVVIRK